MTVHDSDLYCYRCSLTIQYVFEVIVGSTKGKHFPSFDVIFHVKKTPQEFTLHPICLAISFYVMFFSLGVIHLNILARYWLTLTSNVEEN